MSHLSSFASISSVADFSLSLRLLHRVANQIQYITPLVAAPFELAIAIVFLYQLLGWTALAGLSIMLISLPLNRILVKRRIAIHRHILAARDRRMEVLHEFVQAIRFVKYSATEEQWLGRVFSARTVELGWLLRTRMNNLFINVSPLAVER